MPTTIRWINKKFCTEVSVLLALMIPWLLLWRHHLVKYFTLWPDTKYKHSNVRHYDTDYDKIILG